MPAYIHLAFQSIATKESGLASTSKSYDTEDSSHADSSPTSDCGVKSPLSQLKQPKSSHLARKRNVMINDPPNWKKKAVQEYPK